MMSLRFLCVFPFTNFSFLILLAIPTLLYYHQAQFIKYSLGVVPLLCSATHVQNEDGSVILLNPSNLRQRMAIAKKLLTPSKDVSQGGATKKVFRHLKNGDVLLINRQPTLHKPSIMAHKVHVCMHVHPPPPPIFLLIYVGM